MKGMKNIRIKKKKINYDDLTYQGQRTKMLVKKVLMILIM